MAKAQNRVQVILECTTCRKSDSPGVSRYVSVKNRRNTTERIELKKYCKHERKHTVHKEIK
jgi:large subunit ribosomal protein L33